MWRLTAGMSEIDVVVRRRVLDTMSCKQKTPIPILEIPAEFAAAPCSKSMFK